MSTQISKGDLKIIFESDYKNSVHFINNVIKPIFGNMFNAANEDILKNNPDILAAAQRSKVTAITRIGTIENELETTEVLDIELDNSVLLSRSRVNIQQAVRSLVFSYTNAFMIFHYANCEDTQWRFSFLSKKESLNDCTTPKRYTYLFGKGENCHTAAQRFFHLASSSKTTKDMIEAFDVEKLNISFFDEYKRIYGSFCGSLTGFCHEKSKGSNKWTEKPYAKYDDKGRQQFHDVFANDPKATRDYIKKMMGRLVFLKFLEKKGWLGCYSPEGLGSGNRNFLQDCFKHSNHKDDFLDSILEEIFKSLNQQNYQTTNPELKELYFPYLNGGLFEQSSQDDAALQLPASYFEELFEMFNKYNFTIDESSPIDIEVGVDPEMLGHIFENLLEDNKDKGAFYTPKEIVQYMCQQSLIEYLKSHLTGVDASLIEQFVKEKEPQGLTPNHQTRIKQLLADVKICDPAIGSGAFPMGLLQEILALKLQLHISQNSIDSFKINVAKKEIIQNSIYGVDIEQGAVDIARLRFWLSLVVDEDQPLPLPNLDYKIMQGNSLLESFEGIDLSNFGTKGVTEINSMNDLLFGADITKARIRQAMHEYFNTTDGDHKRLIRQEIETHVKEYIKCTCGNNHNIVEKLDAIEPNNRPFFLWHVYFNDVFEQGGFDIVIGNPPYVDVKALDNTEVKQYFDIYRTTSNRINLYSIFIEHGHNILNGKGVLCFINPNSMLLNSSYYKLRSLILSDAILIIKLPDNIFESAKVETIIILLSKNNNTKHIRGKYYPYDECPNFKNIQYSLFDKVEWREDPDLRFNIFADNKTTSLIRKIELNSINLVDFADFCLGITPYDKAKGHNPSFIKSRGFHSDKKISDEYVPLIKGSNIHKYQIIGYSGEFLKYSPELGAPRQRRFFTDEKIIMRQILSTNPLELIAAYSNDDHYFTQIGFSIVPKDKEILPVKYLLCLLNSKVINYIHTNKYLDLEKIMFPKILIENCKRFPIKLIDNKQPFIELVDKIIKAKQTNPSADTSNLEQAIDLMIYKLYNLTEEEIKIIENQ